MTMFDLCRSHADRNPDGMAYIWLDEEESVAQSVTFSELHESALRVAAALRQRRLVGQCAMLMYRPGLDFIVTLLGCFAAGVMAVPVPAGVPRKRAERWARIAEDCTAKAILAGRHTIAEIGQAFTLYPALNALAVVTTDECCNE